MNGCMCSEIGKQTKQCLCEKERAPTQRKSTTTLYEMGVAYGLCVSSTNDASSASLVHSFGEANFNAAQIALHL